MRTSVDRSSPWGSRLWFEEHEFDAMMDEVRLKAGQSAIRAGAGVDVEAILEKVYCVVPDYVGLPDGILGKTVFHRDGQLEVLLSRTLCEEAEQDIVSRRRLRATAAHECAHVVIHGHLHLVATLTIPMFGKTEPAPPKVLCRQESINRPGYNGEWWEYQANRGMGSMLVPKALIGPALKAALNSQDLPSLDEAIQRGMLERIVRGLMNHFDVSMQLVMYRLQQLSMLPKNADQTMLAMEAQEAI